jgi:preprotein translocase subunit SecY
MKTAVLLHAEDILGSSRPIFIHWCVIHMFEMSIGCGRTNSTALVLVAEYKWLSTIILIICAHDGSNKLEIQRSKTIFHYSSSEVPLRLASNASAVIACYWLLAFSSTTGWLHTPHTFLTSTAATTTTHVCCVFAITLLFCMHYMNCSSEPDIAPVARPTTPLCNVLTVLCSARMWSQ